MYRQALLVVGGLILAAAAVRANAPANDNFSNAQAVLPGVTYSGTTLDATREAGDPEDANNRTVWYTLTPLISQVITLSGTSPGNPLAAYLVSGDTLLSSQLLDEGVFTRQTLSFYGVAGHAYRIAIDDYVPGYVNYHGLPFTFGLAGGAALPVDTQFVEPLSNDNFDQALAFSSSSADLVMNTTQATFEPFETNMLNTKFNSRPRYSSSGTGGIWLSWTAPVTGQATISVKTPTADPGVLLIEGQGDSIPDYTPITAAYGGLSFACKQGEVYKLYVLSQKDGQVLFRLNATGTTGGGGGDGTGGGGGAGGNVVQTAHPGTYIGMLEESTFLTFTLSHTRAFTARLIENGVSSVLSGTLDSAGTFLGTYGNDQAVFSVLASGGTTDGAPDDSIAVTASGLTITARAPAYAPRAVPVERGTYTAVFKPGDATATVPQGNGFGRVTVGLGGVVKLTGRLADGTALSASGVLRTGDTSSPQFLFYNPTLYARKGMVAATLTFQAAVDSDLTGILSWTKPMQTRGVYYKAGFSTHVNARGAHYTVPSRGQTVLPVATKAGNLLLSLGGGSLATPLSAMATLTSNNRVVISGDNPNHLRFGINSALGYFSGSFAHPISGRTVAFSGALVQKPGSPDSSGYFFGPVLEGQGFSGSISLSAP